MVVALLHLRRCLPLRPLAALRLHAAEPRRVGAEPLALRRRPADAPPPGARPGDVSGRRHRPRHRVRGEWRRRVAGLERARSACASRPQCNQRFSLIVAIDA